MHAPPGMFDPLRDRDPVQVGPYRLLARLGSGGMGEVFLSFDRSLRPVAVKVLRGELADDRQFRARFAHEVRSARRVRGEGIAPLVDADPEAETPWLATAYIAGPTVADAVELYGPLPVASVLVLMAGIAGALGSIHAAGIVHRDLKPANVVLGADGLRVIDFGIARAADATPLTLTGMLVGSPQYVAPEQALGEPPAPAGDIFSLGALAHYAATGRPAFGEGPRIAVLYRIVNEKPDLAGCPRQIRSLIEFCLDREPAGRPTIPEILELCTPDEPSHRAADWLPPSVVFAIDNYRATLAELTPTPDADGRLPAVPVAATAAPSPARTTSPAAKTHPQLPQAIAPDTDGSDTPSGEQLRLGDFDVTSAALRRPADSDGRSAVSHLRRGALGLAATLAVLGTGIGVALSLPSGNSSAGSVDAFGDTTSASSQQALGGGQGSGQSGGSQSRQPGGPPSIPGLGALPAPPEGPPPGGGPPPPGGPGQGPPPTPTTLWWSGTIRFTSAGLWLDGRPPLAAGGHGDIKDSAQAPANEIFSGAPQIPNLARWTGSGTPTGVQCQTLALAQGTTQLNVAVGDIVCALTAYHQIAVLRIESIPTDDSGVTATATVWGNTQP